jgi:hypothetical protein
MDMSSKESTRRRTTKKKEANAEEIIDSFESWLERQTPKPVRARPGFLADAKIEWDQ